MSSLPDGLAAARSPAPAPLGLEGAPGVDMLPSGTALTDYSRDLVNYLVRVTAEARERRQRIIRGISTREQAVARQQAVVKELWTMLGGPLERGAAESARHRHRPAAGLSDREGRVREPAASLRDGEPLRARSSGTSSGDSGAARPFADRQGLAHVPEAVLEPRAQGLRRARLRPVRAGRAHRVSGRPAWPDRARRRRHRRARVRRAPADSSWRELRVVSRVGRHSRARLPA